jgi:hypothetical protein
MSSRDPLSSFEASDDPTKGLNVSWVPTAWHQTHDSKQKMMIGEQHLIEKTAVDERLYTKKSNYDRGRHVIELWHTQ